MTEAFVKKMHLIGSGYVEMPQDGRRFRFHVERYRDDEGNEWGQILDMQEIPDAGTMLVIPSLGVDAQELEHMKAEYRYEQANPNERELEWRDHRRRRKAHLKQWYADATAQRKAEAKGQRQFHMRRPEESN